MAESSDESIKSLKTAILAELPADTGTIVEFIHSRLRDDSDEWVAVVRVGADKQTSTGRYTDTKFELRTTHTTRLGAMQKLLAALYGLRSHFTGRPVV